MPWRLHTLLLAGLLLAGCGVKGELVKLGEPLPSAVGKPAVNQLGSDLIVSWSLPTVNRDGSKLTDLDHFLVRRLAYPAGDYCAECRDPNDEQRLVGLDRPAPAVRSGDRFSLRDSGLPIETGYRYRIIPVTRDGIHGAAATVHLLLRTPPQPPKAIEVLAQDRSVRLRWQLPPADNLVGVNIYRAAGDVPMPRRPVNAEPVTDGRYDDFGLDNGLTYRYGLRSIIEIDGRRIESDLGEEVLATPRSEF